MMTEKQLYLTRVIAASIGMLSTFLPWMTFGAIFITGTHGLAWLTLPAFGVALAIVLLGDRRLNSWQLLVIELLALLAAIPGLVVLDGVGDGVSIGIGIAFLLGAAMVLVVTSVLYSGVLSMVLFTVVAIVVLRAGTVYIPYGHRLTHYTICKKPSWTLQNTFIDIDKQVGTRVTEEHEQKLLNALVQCGVLTVTPPPPPPPPPQTFGSCTFYGQAGNCMHVDQCNGTYRAGLCAGDADIQCCIP